MSPTTLESERYQPDTSVRMAIRKHAVANLKDHTLAGCKVYDNRSTPPDRSEQPCILVHTKDEPARRFQVTPIAYERELTIEIDIYCEGTEGDANPVDLVDMMASQVERVMHGVQMEIVQAMMLAEDQGIDSPFKFNPDKSGLTGTSMETEGEALRAEAGCRISWRITYVTEVDEAELAGDDITPFELASVQWNLPGDLDVDATDDIRPEQA
jgi:hypothetical protein